MPFLAEVPYETATPELRQVYDTVQKAVGWLPSLFKLQGSHPALIQAEVGLAGVVMGPGELPEDAKEFVAMAVSVFNTSSYCIDVHLEVLRKMGIPHRIVRQLTFGVEEAEVKEEWKALGRFARKITLAPTEISQADFDELRKLGLSDRAILEALAVAAWWNFVNRLAIALGAVPEVR